MYIAGVDEAGRGPLAGPVYAAAVILNPDKPILGLNDSKMISAKKRAELFQQICEDALAFGIGRAEVREIDTLNILQATLLSMRRAVRALSFLPDLVQVDGNSDPKLSCKTELIIEGDKKVLAISAASILAKVLRDREMRALDKEYPGYGFAEHKGYGTQQHLLALKKLGPCKIHRISFAPVRRCMEQHAL